MKDQIDIVVGITILIGVVYRVFHIESAIYKAIEASRKSLNEDIHCLERDLGLHIAIYTERKQQVDYLLHANQEKIDHKANRLFDEIKDIKLEIKRLSEDKKS